MAGPVGPTRRRARSSRSSITCGRRCWRPRRTSGGYTGLFNTGPLVGVVAVLAASRGRASHRRAGPAPGRRRWLCPRTCSRSGRPSTRRSEIFGQMLFMAAVARRGARGAHRLAGGGRPGAGCWSPWVTWNAPTACSSCCSPGACSAVLYAARRFDARAAWFAAGMVVLLPYAAYQAYGLAETYTLANGVPRLRSRLRVMLLAVVAAIVWPGSSVAGSPCATGRHAGRYGWRSGRRSSALRGAGRVGGLRPQLFGVRYGTTTPRAGSAPSTRSPSSV